MAARRPDHARLWPKYAHIFPRRSRRLRSLTREFRVFVFCFPIFRVWWLMHFFFLPRSSKFLWLISLEPRSFFDVGRMSVPGNISDAVYKLFLVLECEWSPTAARASFTTLVQALWMKVCEFFVTWILLKNCIIFFPWFSRFYCFSLLNNKLAMCWK